MSVPRLSGARAGLLASGDPLDETDVTMLRLMAYAQSDAEIARHLKIAFTTSRGRTKRLFAKLGAANRTQAVAVAYEAGILGVAQLGPESTAARPPAARTGAGGPGVPPGSCEAPEGAPAAFVLSTEHQQVLRLVAENLGDQQIAARLNLTADQVKQRVRDLYAATSTSTRTGLIAWGKQSGIVTKAGLR